MVYDIRGIALITMALSMNLLGDWLRDALNASEVTGRRYHLTELNRNATIIENIDGNSAFPTDRSGSSRASTS